MKQKVSGVFLARGVAGDEKPKRLVGRSAAGDAVGVATVTSARQLMKYLQILRSSP